MYRYQIKYLFGTVIVHVYSIYGCVGVHGFKKRAKNVRDFTIKMYMVKFIDRGRKAKTNGNIFYVEKKYAHLFTHKPTD